MGHSPRPPPPLECVRRPARLRAGFSYALPYVLLLVQMPPAPPARCAIYSAGSTKRREARKIFRLLGLQRQKKQVEEGTSNECECTQSESRYLLCSVISLRESKARKGKDLLQGREREQRQRQTKSKGTDSLHPTLRTSRDGAKHDVAHRKAKTSQIASEKHEVRRRTKQSTTSSKQSTTSSKPSMASSKPSMASEA